MATAALGQATTACESGMSPGSVSSASSWSGSAGSTATGSTHRHDRHYWSATAESRPLRLDHPANYATATACAAGLEFQASAAQSAVSRRQEGRQGQRLPLLLPSSLRPVRCRRSGTGVGRAGRAPRGTKDPGDNDGGTTTGGPRAGGPRPGRTSPGPPLPPPRPARTGRDLRICREIRGQLLRVEGSWNGASVSSPGEGRSSPLSSQPSTSGIRHCSGQHHRRQQSLDDVVLWSAPSPARWLQYRSPPTRSPPGEAQAPPS